MSRILRSPSWAGRPSCLGSFRSSHNLFRLSTPRRLASTSPLLSRNLATATPCARLSSYSSPSPSNHQLRVSSRFPGSLHNLGQRAAYSTENPKPDPSNNKDDLPPGWVRLRPDEIETFRAQMKLLPSAQRGYAESTIAQMERFGAPEELRAVMKRVTDRGSWTISDASIVMRLAPQMVARYAQLEEQQDHLRDEEDPSSSSDQEPSDTKKKKTDSHSKSPKQNTQEPKDDEDASSPFPFFGPPGQKSKKKQSQDGTSGGGKSDKKEDGPGIRTSDWIVLGASLLVLYPFVEGIVRGQEREITWQELRRIFLDKGLVEKLTVSEGRVEVQLNRDAVQAVYGSTEGVNPNMRYYFSIGSVESFENKLEEAQDELQIPSTERIPVSYGKRSGMWSLVLAFGPTLVLVGLMLYATRQMGARGGNQMFGFGKSRAKKFNHETDIRVKFSDVAGMDEAKTEIQEFVSFLKKPERFERLGAKIPRGAILSGPPGTGKTLLAKATAGESGVPFFSVSGSEFVEMFVGVGPSRVRDLFATARKNAPCIIFIDEIDAIGRSRTDSNRMGGNDERESTLNQILTEMDGFNTSEQVVVLAGTNRADVLDKALMRPGRFDRHIYIDRPTMKGRESIFRVHLLKIVTHEDLDYLTGRLATLTPGFSGADIANVVNEAALIAARANAATVTLLHFEQAIERVIGGLERKSLVLNPTEKKTVAYHEAGHAICGWFLQFADPLLKVSIIPRGQGALGYAQYLPQDAYLMSHDQLMDRMAMTLGGRVSEEMHFPTVTTGASDDFKKVTDMAHRMVTQWGMSNLVGPVHYENNPNHFHKPYAESTAQEIDKEIHRIIEEAYQRCTSLLQKHKAEVGKVAEELLSKEVLSRDDMVRILGPRPFGDNQDFEKYFGGLVDKDKKTADGTEGKKSDAAAEDGSKGSESNVNKDGQTPPGQIDPGRTSAPPPPPEQ